MIDSTLYSVEIYKQDISIEEFNRIVALFRYQCQKSGSSFLLILSTTNSTFAFPIIEQTGKRGRPKRKVYGKKVPPHVHTAVLGTAEKSAFSTAQKICKRLREKHDIAGKVVSKGQGQHGQNYISYLYIQRLAEF